MNRDIGYDIQRSRDTKKDGPDRGSNPEPLAPKARIIPLDHQATLSLLTNRAYKPTLECNFPRHTKTTLITIHASFNNNPSNITAQKIIC